jgi:peptidoglycan/LPS O-acetylase OafA/YrhL
MEEASRRRVLLLVISLGLSFFLLSALSSVADEINGGEAGPDTPAPSLSPGMVCAAVSRARTRARRGLMLSMACARAYAYFFTPLPSPAPARSLTCARSPLR